LQPSCPRGGSAQLANRQNTRDKDRSTLYHGYLQKIASVFDLKGDEQEEFAKLAFQLENKRLVMPDKFKKTGTTQLEKAHEIVNVPVFELNDEHYRKLEEYLVKESVSTNVRAAYLDARRALDSPLIQTYEKLAEIKNLDPTLIEEYRNQMGRIHNYFPHNRYEGVAEFAGMTRNKKMAPEVGFEPTNAVQRPVRLSRPRALALAVETIRRQPAAGLPVRGRRSAGGGPEPRRGAERAPLPPTVERNVMSIATVGCSKGGQ
jgi:hypothetical protein